LSRNTVFQAPKRHVNQLYFLLAKIKKGFSLQENLPYVNFQGNIEIVLNKRGGCKI